MEEGVMMKSMALGMGALVAMTIGMSVISSYTPQVTYYTCPICGAQFTSEADLISHFEAEHPSEPIDIIWE